MPASDTDHTVLSKRLTGNDDVDPAVLGFLLDPGSYGPGIEFVSVVESHMSLVFLAGERAYKMKKPIILDELNLRSLDARQLNCEREIELNRALSPDIYLGLETVTRDNQGGLQLGGSGQIAEWLVVMRRLDDARLLDHAIAAGNVARGDIESLIEVLVPFYSKPLKRPPSGTEVLAVWSSMFERTARSLRRLEYGLPPDLVEAVQTELGRFLKDSSELILARVDAGWIRECHGDLRPQHVYLGPPLRLIDRLEFDERLRKRDPFEEILDLGIECERMGAGWILPMLYDGVARHLGGRPDQRLFGFYAGMRASLRARFAIEHIGTGRGSSDGWRERAMASLDLARKYACPQS